MLILIIFVLAFSLAPGSIAQQKPKIGLALSGGGARGIAHIGVLKVLEEEGIPIDMIAGTSMGSIVGGLYAMGYGAHDLEELIASVDWPSLFSSSTERRYLNMQEKLWDSRYLISLPIVKRKIQLPTGLVSDQRISQILTRLTLPAHTTYDFKQLPIPFVCVAADIVTGEAVVLDHGFLADAMRASMSIPSVFSPVKIDDRLLVDGGIVRNLPVQDVVNLGADAVIAVDVRDLVYTEKQLDSFAKVLYQWSSLTIEHSTAIQLKQANVAITPDLSGFSIMAFGDFDEILARGEQAARAALPQIKALIDSLGRSSNAEPKHRAMAIPDSFYVARVELEGLKRVKPRLIIRELTLKPPTNVSPEDLDENVDRLFSTTLFERVAYRLSKDSSGTYLSIHLEEDSEKLLRAAVRYDTNTNAAVLGNLLLRNVTGAQSSVTLDLKLGEQFGFSARYFGHPGWFTRIGLYAGLNINDSFVDLFGDGDRIARVDYKSVNVETGIGSIFSTSLLFGIGIRYQLDNGSQEIASDSTFFDAKTLPLVNVIWYDSFDRANFPTQGLSLLILNEAGFEKFASDSTFSLHYFQASARVALRPSITLITGLAAGFSTGDLPSSYQFVLGGMNSPMLLNRMLTRTSFVGLKYQEQIGRYVQMLYAGIQTELLPQAFLTLRGNMGNTFEHWNTDFNLERFKFGVGVGFGVSTLLGPIEVTGMYGSRKELQFYLNFGLVF